jgi:O-antigen/teichoic acid export membrane protein
MNLKDKTINSFLWLSSTKFISQGFSWVVTILLARLLVPADFGLIAMAIIFIGFLELINELGIGAAIVQKKDLEEDDLHSTFWFSILFGFILYAFIFFSAPIIGFFFGSEKLSIILRVLGINFVIGAFKVVPYNVLAKELAFNKRSKAELSSVITGGIASLALATLGYGVWSLVYGSLVYNLVLVTLVIYFCQWRPRPIFHFRKVKKMLDFGLSVAGSQVLWYFYQNSDSLIIGKILGNIWLGFYSMAFRLSTLPVQKITAIFNQISFPVFSRLQNDKKTSRLYFLKITRLVSLITFPCIVGLFMVSESLIQVVLTDKWLPMLTPLKILCIIGILRSVSAIIPPYLVAMGKQHIILKFNVITAVVLPISFLIGINFGISGVALAWVFVYPFVLTYLYQHGLNELNLTFYEYLNNLIPSVAASVFMACTVLFFQFFVEIFYSSIYIELVGSFALGVISYFVYLLIFYRDNVIEILSIFRSLVGNKLENEFVLQ